MDFHFRLNHNNTARGFFDKTPRISTITKKEWKMINITEKCMNRLLLCLAFAVFSMITSSCAAKEKDEPQKSDRQKTKEYEKLIDALVNHNPKPEIVRPTIRTVPIFDKGYDWEEQERVLRAIHTLAAQTNPEMWEVLVSHDNDDRYCLTFGDENRYADNESVGYFCGDIAYNQLMFPVERNLERINLERQAKGLHVVVLGGVESLKKWRESHSNMLYYELQIEVCKIALEELAGIKGVSEKAKEDCRTRLKAEIDTLKRTKEGVFTKFKFPGDRYEIYTKEKADYLKKKAAEERK
jgi:hypothetical protein